MGDYRSNRMAYKRLGSIFAPSVDSLGPDLNILTESL